MQTEQNRLLTATYKNEANFARIDYFMDDSVSYVAGGNVSDKDLDAMFAAQGAKVDGFTVEIKL